jgi:hypothetical protein
MQQPREKESRFQIEPLEERIAPTGAAMTTTLLNPAGNTPQGNGASNGAAITTVVTNPAGHQPPGQQP